MNKQNWITANTIQSYLAAIKSYHIDRNLPIKAFKNFYIDHMLKDTRHLYLHSKQERLPIIKDILTKITSATSITVEEVNIDIAFNVAWAGFLRLDKITYTKAEA